LLKGGWDTAGYVFLLYFEYEYSFEFLLFSFITQYLSLLLFFVLFGIGQLIYRTRIVRASDQDFVTGLKEIEADTYDEPPPKNMAERFWRWLVSTRECYLTFWYGETD
jgi:amino acid transporter